MINDVLGFTDWKAKLTSVVNDDDFMERQYRQYLQYAITKMLHRLGQTINNRVQFGSLICGDGGVAIPSSPYPPVATVELHRWALTILTLVEAAYQAPDTVDVSMDMAKDQYREVADIAQVHAQRRAE